MLGNIWVTSLLVALIFSTADGQSTMDTCIVTETNDCALDTLQGPTFFYPGGSTRCGFDTNRDKNTNATYRYEVFPGSAENHKSVVMFFQGGGGCFSESTCEFDLQETLRKLSGMRTFLAEPTYESEGIFNRANPRNPFRDWTIIKLSYCTADGHVGDRVLPGETMDLNMNGLTNTLEVWKWMQENLPDPDRLVLAGVSAGSLGVQTVAWHILSQLHLGRTQASIILDAYVGYLPHEITQVFPFINACNPAVLSEAMMDLCVKGQMSLVELVHEVQNDFPNVPVAFISSKKDQIQRVFYCLAMFRNSIVGVISNMFQNLCISEGAFLDGMYSHLHSFTQGGLPNSAISYWTNEDVHGYLNSNELYSAHNGNNDEMSLIDWMNQIISRSIRQERIGSYCVPGESNMTFCAPEVANAVYLGEDLRMKDTNVNYVSNPASEIHFDTFYLTLIVLVANLTPYFQ